MTDPENINSIVETFADKYVNSNILPQVNYVQNDHGTIWTYGYNCYKSAREQVQDEILTKVAQAVEEDDLKKAKQLLALAKQLKEL